MISAMALLLIGSIVASLAGAGVAGYSAYENKQAQVAANQTNLDLQERANSANLEIAKMNNQTQLDIAKNAHQYEMADLKAAGLNPVLTATGGQGASIGSLSTPRMDAARVQATPLDLSGVSSALNSMSNLMMMSMIMNGRMKMNDDRVGAYQQRTENMQARNYAALGSKAASRSVINSARQLSHARNNLSPRQNKIWDKIIDDLEKYSPKKY